MLLATILRGDLLRGTPFFILPFCPVLTHLYIFPGLDSVSGVVPFVVSSPLLFSLLYGAVIDGMSDGVDRAVSA